MKTGTNTIEKYVTRPPKAVEEIFDYLNIIIKKNQPFSVVEDPYFRKISKYNNSTLSRKTIMRYLRLVTEEVRQKIELALPQKFGIIFDGWSDPINTHHVGIFATYCDEKGLIYKIE